MLLTKLICYYACKDACQPKLSVAVSAWTKIFTLLARLSTKLSVNIHFAQYQISQQHVSKLVLPPWWMNVLNIRKNVYGLCCLFSHIFLTMPQSLGTKHNRRIALVCVEFWMHLYSLTSLIWQMPPPTFNNTAIIERHPPGTFFRAHWVLISWSIWMKKLIDMLPILSWVQGPMCERRALNPLCKALCHV